MARRRGVKRPKRPAERPAEATLNEEPSPLPLPPAGEEAGPETEGKGREEGPLSVRVAVAATPGRAQPYVAQEGDSVAGLAERFAVEGEWIVAANPEIPDPERLRAGTVLVIPGSPPIFPAARRAAFPYIARSGDTLAGVATAFGTTVERLRRANPLLPATGVIVPGELLFVPTVEAPPAPVGAILYRVAAEESLGAIGARFNVDAEAMRAANPQVRHPDRVLPGEFVVVPVAGVPEEPVFERVRYAVQAGDTLETIAARFNTSVTRLAELNPILRAEPDVLLIPAEANPAPVPEPRPGFPPCQPAPFGERLELADDDTRFVPFPEGFTFTFFGREWNGLFVNSNGNLTFGEGDVAFFPSLDAAFSGPPRIAPFWVDLNPAETAGGGVFTGLFPEPAGGGARFVVTYDRVPYFGTDAFNTVQVSLHANGSIQFCYFEVAPLPEALRPLIGLVPGGGEEGANLFVFNGAENPRRAGDPAESTPDGDLSGRILLYHFDPAVGAYRMTFA